MSEIEDSAPRPWVKPSVGVLDQAGGTQAEIPVHTDGELLCACRSGDLIQMVMQYPVVTTYNTARRTLIHHELCAEYLISAAFSDDGTRLITVNEKGKVLLWNRASGYVLEKCIGSFEDENCVVGISGNGRAVAYSSKGTIFVQDANGDTHYKTFSERMDSSRFLYNDELCMSFNGKQLVYRSYTESSIIDVWDRDTDNDKMVPAEVRNSNVRRAAISKDGRWVASGSEDGTIWIWDMKSAKRVVHRWKGYSESVSEIIFGQSGMNIISSSAREMSVCVWNADNGAMVGHLEKIDFQYHGLAGSQCGKEVVVIEYAEKGMRIRVLYMEETVKGDLGERKERYQGVIAYCVDRKMIVSGDEDGEVRMWDSESGTLIGQPLKGYLTKVSYVSFSACGTRILCAAYGQGIEIWDTNSQNAVAMRRLSNVFPWPAINSDSTKVVYGNSFHMVGLPFAPTVNTVELWDVHRDMVTTVTRDAYKHTCGNER